MAPWPFKHIRRSSDERDSGVMAIGAPLDDQAHADFRRFRDAGYRFVGVSSYQEFPAPIQNPVTHGCGRNEPWFDSPSQREAASCIEGWLTCARDEVRWLPAGPIRQTALALAESDFIDPSHPIYRHAHRVAKRYDFAYLCQSGAWNGHIRNYQWACTLIPFLARDFGLSTLILGRPETDRLSMPRHDLIHFHDYLRWPQFQRAMQSCRFLLLPNGPDASPRVMTEAFCSNMAVLANANIHGGWKHLADPRAASTFTNDTDFPGAVRRLLARAKKGTLHPRKYFIEYQASARPERQLYDFCAGLISRNGGHR